MSKRRTYSLIHRGYLYAQKRVKFHPTPIAPETPSELRMVLAKAYRDGYLAARRDRRRNAKKT